jgi:hypothetical protein
MIGQDKEEKNTEPLAQPSEGPLKNEPTPERAREEKEKQEEEACPKGS